MLLRKGNKVKTKFSSHLLQKKTINQTTFGQSLKPQLPTISGHTFPFATSTTLVEEIEFSNLESEPSSSLLCPALLQLARRLTWEAGIQFPVLGHVTIEPVIRSNFF